MVKLKSGEKQTNKLLPATVCIQAMLKSIIISNNVNKTRQNCNKIKLCLKSRFRLKKSFMTVTLYTIEKIVIRTINYIAANCIKTAQYKA